MTLLPLSDARWADLVPVGTSVTRLSAIIAEIGKLRHWGKEALFEESSWSELEGFLLDDGNVVLAAYAALPWLVHFAVSHEVSELGTLFLLALEVLLAEATYLAPPDAIRFTYDEGRGLLVVLAKRVLAFAGAAAGLRELAFALLVMDPASPSLSRVIYTVSMPGRQYLTCGNCRTVLDLEFDGENWLLIGSSSVVIAPQKCESVDWGSVEAEAVRWGNLSAYASLSKVIGVAHCPECGTEIDTEPLLLSEWTPPG
jgi:hypothetical protein